jgi:hypothetical protein
LSIENIDIIQVHTIAHFMEQALLHFTLQICEQQEFVWFDASEALITAERGDDAIEEIPSHTERLAAAGGKWLELVAESHCSPPA